MRIALLHYTSLPVIAGVELILGGHAQVLADAGHEVTVITGNGDDACGQTREGWTMWPPTVIPAELLAPESAPGPPRSVRMVAIPELRAESHSAQRARGAAERGGADSSSFRLAVNLVKQPLREVLAAQDAVILHNVMTMQFHLALTAALWELADELPAARFICWIHDLAACNPDYASVPFGREPWHLLTRAHPRCEYIAVSELRRRQFVQLTGEPATRCRVIPNGVEPTRTLDLPISTAGFAQAWSVLEREVVLLHPTRLLRRKNVELTLRVAAALKVAGRSCACLITAPPDAQNPASVAYNQELRELQIRLGLREDAFFLNDGGPLWTDEMRGLFALADALFFPSRQEGFGLPLLEAALHRLPIFCSDIEPLNSLLGGDVTVFPPDGAPATIATLIQQTLDSHPAHRARKRALRIYSWRAIHRNFLAPLLAELKTPPAMKLSASVPTIEQGAIDAICGAYHGDPFAVLGMHQAGEQLVVRVFRPDARAVTVQDLDTGAVYPALQAHPDGFFEAALEGAEERFPYTLNFTAHDGHEWTERDPYSFGVILGPLDLHLFAEGQHWDLYKKMGAHLMEIEGVKGTAFHVWAPNAQRISVVGDFNVWDGRRHPMRKLLGCGVWEIFLPGITEGAHYKFEVKQCHGNLVLKSDPFAFYGQHGTATASMVFDLRRYSWSDASWMESRDRKNWQREPVSIYEVHLGSWRRKVDDGNRWLSYRELADELLDYVKYMGYTHVELLPVAEHPFDGSWGYQVCGYFAPTSRFGNPDEFRYFVDQAHQKGLGVILDWVPAHFPKDSHGLAEFDGTDLYEHADPRKGEHMDWGTLIPNFGRNEVRNFFIANALFWLDEYHIDGLRVDAVASMLYLDYSRKHDEWVPNEYGGRENLEAIYFLKRFNEVCYERHPGIMTIAEESTAWPGVSRPTYLGGLGFGFKWNMGWMHDFLTYMEKDPAYRRYHQGDITFSLIYAFHEHFVLVLSHDEVVHGKGSLIDKMPGDLWQKFANLRMFYAWMYAHPGKKLLFMGQEFGQWREWKHDTSLDWHLAGWGEHEGLKRLLQHLNWVYKNEPALYELDDSYEGFEWIDFHDSDNSVVAFMRKSRSGDVLAFVINATPVPREAYRIGVNGDGWYQEFLNTDAAAYGGGDIGNFGGQHAEQIGWQGKSHSLLLRLPPLAVVGFKRHPYAPPAPAPELTADEIPAAAVEATGTLPA